MVRDKSSKEKRIRPRIDWSTVQRLLSYLWKDYKVRFVLVVVFVIASSIVSVSISMFFQVLIDDYITPLMLESNPVFTGLLREILRMAVIAFIGVLSMWLNDRFMAEISQGILKTIRDEMFVHMQSLPVAYFDTNTAGDVMSHYTNDTDTLRQMLSQSIPQILSAVVTIITVTIAMLVTSVHLTIFVAIYLVFMLQITGRIAANSGQYFSKQQEAIGNLNGYIEEMIEGQKVIKVDWQPLFRQIHSEQEYIF